MSIDFHALIREQFGPESSPLKIDGAAFRKMQSDFEAAVIRYLAHRVGTDQRVADVLDLNRNTVRAMRRRAGVDDIYTRQRKEGLRG